MYAITPLLLCLLSALVEVHSQTFPYVSFMGTNLPNHSYVDLTLVGYNQSGSDSVQCHTDLAMCCSTIDHGGWYFPSGNRLPTPYPGYVFESREAQRVDLRHGRSGDASGIYHCSIDTVATSNNGRKTVYVGLYTSGGEDACMWTAVKGISTCDAYDTMPQRLIDCCLVLSEQSSSSVC